MSKSIKRGTTISTSNHHAHKHQHIDASDEFKTKSFLSIKRRRAIGKFMYTAMCIVATLIVVACIISVFA